MRFLKNKIARAQEFLVTHQEPQPTPSTKRRTSKITAAPLESSPSFQGSPTSQDLQPKTRRRVQGRYFTSERARSTKNVVKNFGKAICSFAVSDLALLYLNPMLEKEGVTHDGFVNFIGSNKESIESIQSFRAVLLVNEDDRPELKSFRKILGLIGEVFIKYFSVNWIFSGRVTHKEAHLKFRFKMLRRIKDPESFTYIQKPYRRKQNYF